MFEWRHAMSNIDIGLYTMVVRRRLVLAMTIVFAALCTSVAVAFLWSPVYVATAKILVQAAQIPSTLARATVSTSAVQQFQILQQQITSRASLVVLAQRSGIFAADPEKPTEEEMTRDLLQRIRFDQVAMETPDPGQGAAIYTISFSAGKSEEAALIANELAEMILINSQSQRTDRAGRTLNFFDQQVSGLNAQLEKIEDEILAFKNAHSDSLPESLAFRRSRDCCRSKAKKPICACGSLP
jgi:polysaccharide biosynthesis transport protein